MSYFRNGFSFYDVRANRPLREPRVSLFSGGMFHAVRLLVTIAFMLIGMGILIILFPLVLACFVAGLFFFIACICLYQAWKMYRFVRGFHKAGVDVTDIEDDIWD